MGRTVNTSGLNTASQRIAVAREHQAVLGLVIPAPFEHQSLQGTVMVCPTVGKYRLQVVTVLPVASVSTLLLS